MVSPQDVGNSDAGDAYDQVARGPPTSACSGVENFPFRPGPFGEMALSLATPSIDGSIDMATCVMKAEARAERAEIEIVRLQTHLADSHARHRDTAQLLEHLSSQNADLRQHLERAKDKIAELTHLHEQCELKHGALLKLGDGEKLQSRSPSKSVTANVLDMAKLQQQVLEVEPPQYGDGCFSPKVTGKHEPTQAAAGQFLSRVRKTAGAE